LEAENAKLTVIIGELRAEIDALRKSESPPATFVKPNTHKEKRSRPKKTRRQRAVEQNAARKKEPASQVTEIRQHALERCPGCDYKLSGKSIARRRQVIDLPVMPALQVVEHQVIKRWCPKCKKWHVPVLDLSNEVLGQGRMGHGIASLVSWLRTTLRLPVKRVQNLLQKIYKLKLSVGEIVELTHAVAKAGQNTVAQIKQAIVSSPHVHMDETGWREDGDNGYAWASSTPEGLRAFEFHFSRAGAVPEAVLDGFTGTLVTDFYGGYNHTDGRHQRCWVHLLRDLRQLKADHAVSHPEVLAWIDSVVKTYHQGKALAQRDPPLTSVECQTLFDDLVDRVDKLGLRWPKDKGHPAHALCKRLLRHSAELFEFVLQPGLSPDNNLAERSVRPLVIARKIGGGTRSKQGSDTRMDLQTLFATWTAQGKHALDLCRHMLASYRPAATLPLV
jgi:transposase